MRIFRFLALALLALPAIATAGPISKPAGGGDSDGANCLAGEAAAGVDAGNAAQGCAIYLKSITADAGGTTTGGAITFVGGINANTTRSGDTITINNEVVASESGAAHLCESGSVQGGGFDAVTGKWAWTCGNWNWSAVRGGVASGVATPASYLTATTAGGNAFKISCTAPGVGTGSDGVTYDITEDLQIGAPTDATATGGTTTTLTDTISGVAQNAYRDQIIKMTSGVCNGVERLITGNSVSSTVTYTIQGTWDGAGGDACTGAPTAPGSGDTYVIRDPLGSVCDAAGDFAVVNIMPDLMLALDNTKPGGKVYMPIAEGHTNTLYINRGCGRKGHGPTGTVFNSCPVLQYPNDFQYQRDIATMSGIEVVWEGTDPDGWANGRVDAWYVDDTGSGHPNGAWIGIEPSTGLPNQKWPLKAGLDIQSKLCTPNALGYCTVASGTGELTANRAGRVFTPFNNADVTTKGGFCANNQDSVSGTCQGDPRIQCTTDAVCDFSSGGAGNRGDLGPCLSQAELLEYLVARGDAYVGMTQAAQVYPETTAGGASQDHAVGRVVSVSGSTCGAGGNGRLFAFAGWPWSYAAFRTGSGAFYLYDWRMYNQAGGGHFGGTFSPNNWYGRDPLPGSGEIGECLSGGTTPESDDEPVCDTAHLIASHAGIRAHWNGNVITNAGSEGFGWDGNQGSYLGESDRTIYRDNKRYAWFDWSSMNVTNLSVLDNLSTDLLSTICFSGPSSNHSGWLFDGNRSHNSFLLSFSGAQRNCYMKDWTVRNSSGFEGAFQIVGGHNISMDDFKYIGNGDTGLALGIWPAGPTHNVRVSNWRLSGRGNIGRSNFSGTAAITIDPSKMGGGLSQPLSGIFIDDVRMDTPESNSCLLYLHNDAADGVAEQSYPQISVTNSSISNTNSSTGAKAICFDNLGDEGGGVFGGTAATDDGILASRYRPSWSSLSENDVFIPSKSWPSMTIASAGSCSADKVGMLVEVTNHNASSCPAAATFTSGTNRVTCLCDGTNWVTPGSGGGGGSGDITDVWGCTTGNCSALTGASGDTLDAGLADTSRPATRTTALPGTCSEGQLHQDTDSGPGTETYVCTATNSWMRLAGTTEFRQDCERHVLFLPQDSDDHIGGEFGYQSGTTVVNRLHCIATGGGTISWTPQECDADGSPCTDTEAAITCDADGTTITSVDDQLFDPGDLIKHLFSAPTGTVDQLAITVCSSGQLVR